MSESEDKQQDCSEMTVEDNSQCSKTSTTTKWNSTLSTDLTIKEFFAWKKYLHNVTLKNEALQQKLDLLQEKIKKMQDNEAALLKEKSKLNSITIAQQGIISKMFHLEKGCSTVTEEVNSMKTKVAKLVELVDKKAAEHVESVRKNEQIVEKLKAQFSETQKVNEVKFQELLFQKDNEIQHLKDVISSERKNQEEEINCLRFQYEEKIKMVQRQMALLSTKQTPPTSSSMFDIYSKKLKLVKDEYEGIINGLKERIRLYEMNSESPHEVLEIPDSPVMKKKITDEVSEISDSSSKPKRKRFYYPADNL